MSIKFETQVKDLEVRVAALEKIIEAIKNPPPRETLSRKKNAKNG